MTRELEHHLVFSVLEGPSTVTRRSKQRRQHEHESPGSNCRPFLRKSSGLVKSVLHF